MAGCLLSQSDFDLGTLDGDLGLGGIDGCIERVEGKVVLRARWEGELQRDLLQS